MYNWRSMRLIAHSISIWEADYGLQVNGQLTGARLAGHLKEVLHRFELTDSHLLQLTINNASWNYSMTREAQTTLEASALEWPALRNRIPCMVHVIQLALGAFMGTLGVKGSTKSWEAHERDQQFGENESTDIGRSRQLRKEGNAIINKVSAMRPGLAKIIENVPISTYFESAETDIHIAENACCIDYTDTWSSKRVHWMSTSQSPDCNTTQYGYEDTLKLDNGVARALLWSTWINNQEA